MVAYQNFIYIKPTLQKIEKLIIITCVIIRKGATYAKEKSISNIPTGNVEMVSKVKVVQKNL